LADSTSKPKLLFVTEKWAECNPQASLSNVHHNFINSLAASDLADWQAFHYDEVAVQTGERADGALIKQCQDWRPDIIFFRQVPGTDLNPKPDTFATLKDKIPVTVFSQHCDTFDERAMERIAVYYDQVDVNVVIDCYSVYPQFFGDSSRFLDTWTPQDPALFHSQSGDRPIAVSFAGSTDYYPDRKAALNSLQQTGLPMHVAGGFGDTHLPIEDYAALLQQSKITLNFSTISGLDQIKQCKGRTMEALFSGCLLLEEASPETRKWLTPDVHYVEFETAAELEDKITYFLAHDQEREKIAAAGHDFALANYAAEHFWQKILQRAL